MSTLDIHICASVIEFTDDSFIAQALHTGDLKSCEKVRDMIPAISYSGDKTPSKSYLTIIEKDLWDKAFNAEE